MIAREANFSCNAVGATDTGLVREHNEDCFLINENSSVFIVADGVGGHSKGEVASEIASTVAMQSYLNDVGLEQAICTAHNAVKEKALELEAAAGMSTTLAMAAVVGSKINIAWVGDSRIYRFNPTSSEFSQVSKDHSLVQMLIDQGVISHDEAKSHPKKNIILQAVGQSGLELPSVDELSFDLLQGDVFLLCSDGLTDMVDDESVADILRRDLTLQEKVNYLIGAALKGGGKDNVTVLLIEIV